jgi:hypothetical protein
MKKLLTSLKTHLLKYFKVGGQFKNKQEADKDYLHFLSSTGRHNNVVEILTSKYSTDEEKFNQLVNWVNKCIEETNQLNKKYGHESYSEEILNEKFKIRRDNGTFHFGKKIIIDDILLQPHI